MGECLSHVLVSVLVAKCHELNSTQSSIPDNKTQDARYSFANRGLPGVSNSSTDIPYLDETFPPEKPGTLTNQFQECNVSIQTSSSIWMDWYN